jgi:hypothetical protein
MLLLVLVPAKAQGKLTCRFYEYIRVLSSIKTFILLSTSDYSNNLVESFNHSLANRMV